MGRSMAYRWMLGLMTSLIPLASWAVDPSVVQLVVKGDTKGAIALGQRELPNLSGSEKAALQVDLAVAYARDQELESAFAIYLDAIEGAPKLQLPQVSTEEQRLFDDALALYLDQQGPSAHHAAKDIERDYIPYADENPSYYLLGFVAALAEANLGHFEQFFPRFYASYQRYPDHYLAYKTKAILNLKLWQRGRLPGEREQLRGEISSNLSEAMARYPRDASLYKMSITFANEKEKQQVVEACLKNIVRENIMVPREDVLFFVQAGIDTGHDDLAQAFVDSARSWYKRSRAVERAQQLIHSKP
ncbi:MAG: hypothetical protein E6Q59_00950 [Nitrosomonas sp.]|nr:MAG: hypothetical protein E6Q59_00950 [Nitrosomonas sp.]